jgi:glycosyltransferase involved in cell wall biosynthesis
LELLTAMMAAAKERTQRLPSRRRELMTPAGAPSPGDLPTVSIVIPCYNGIRFVADAVQSVIDQADDGVECIVVDDGSTDGSSEMLRQRFGERIRVVRQPNQGVAEARNRGFTEAAGELVIWLDADDMLAADTLSDRRRAFAEDSLLEMLVGQIRIVNIDTGAEQISPIACGRDYLQSSLLALTNPPHSNILTFKSASARRLGGYNVKARIAEDFDYWLRAWAQLRWRFVRQIQSIQRIGSFPSLIRTNSKIFAYEEIGRALLRNRELIDATTGSSRAWRRGYSHFAADFAQILLAHGDRGSARKWAWMAIRTGRSVAERRAFTLLLESILPSAAYACGRAALIRIGLLRRQPAAP